MAGVVASRRQWKSLYSAWRKSLKHGKPIRYFKMYGSASKTGEFLGWKRAEITRKVEQLTAVLRENASDHVALVIPMLPFRHVMKRSSLPDEYQDPYLLCFLESLRAVNTKMESLGGPQRKPLLIYDNQKKFIKKHCRDLFMRIHAEPPDHPMQVLGRWLRKEPEFKDDQKEEIGIQAADLVAWHYRTLPWESRFKKHRRRRFVTQIEGLPLIAKCPDYKEIEEWRWTLHRFLRAVEEENRQEP